MCGIAGLVGSILSPSEAPAVLAQMLDRLVNRGPDGEGIWTDEPGTALLGHRRLAIVDLSPGGAQPMVSADGRWVVSFNGELYGYRERCRELEGRGVRLRTQSDTEVLLEMVARDGVVKTLERINAMYGIALWDRQRRELWLARDPVGEKPLYVAERPDGVAFASEVAALRRVPGFDDTIDHAALASYLELGYVPAPRTIYQGATKLCRGEWRRYGADGRLQDDGAVTCNPPDGATDDLLELLTDAVAIRTVADVPVGVFLSGGIDSTIVAALAARAGETRTFTATFTEASHDESAHARAVATALGTEHTELAISAEEGLELASRLPALYGEPFGDPSAIPTHLIAREARKSVTVALTGDGGDELFGGYNRLVVGAQLERWRHRLPSALRVPVGRALARAPQATLEHLAAALTRASGGGDVPNIAEKLHKAGRVLGAGSVEGAIRGLLAIWPDPSQLLAGASSFDYGLQGLGFAEELLSLDRRLTLSEQMLTKVDRATMAVALEARPPLLDPRVVALAGRGTLDQHVQGGVGKQMLRRILPELIDPRLLDRPKMGFDPPIGAWLRGPLRHWAQELLEPSALRASGITGVEVVQRSLARHLAGGAGEDYRLWTVLQYQLWFSTVHEGHAPPAPPVRSAPRSRLVGPPPAIRPFAEQDRVEVDELLASAMQRHGDPARFRELLRWKHERNPFGESPAWVAEEDGQIIGYRAFLRWRFDGLGRSWSAVRAVDTATHPEHQGRGIFRLLTLQGLEALHAEGVDFVFNTPNDQSRPGYLKMGWRLVDRLIPWVQPSSLRSLPAIARSREPAGHWGEPTSVGVTAEEAFGDDVLTEQLLHACRSTDGRLRTSLSPAYLRWRYDHPLLGYRIVTLGADLREGAVGFRLRRRGTAVEATIGDLFSPGNDRSVRRRLIRETVRRTGADYGLLLGGHPSDGAVPLPGTGPTLVWRDLKSTTFPSADRWDLTMGDIELF